MKKSESNQYRCRVDYYEAEDGEKVKKSIEIKFPAEGCISAAGSEAECPADEDDSRDAAVGTFAPVTKNEDGKIKIQLQKTRFHVHRMSDLLLSPLILVTFL